MYTKVHYANKTYRRMRQNRFFSSGLGPLSSRSKFSQNTHTHTPTQRRVSYCDRIRSTVEVCTYAIALWPLLQVSLATYADAIVAKLAPLRLTVRYRRFSARFSPYTSLDTRREGVGNRIPHLVSGKAFSLSRKRTARRLSLRVSGPESVRRKLNLHTIGSRRLPISTYTISIDKKPIDIHSLKLI